MAFGDFTVVRSTVKRVLNSSGVLASVAVNTPAFEFNADGSYKGLLVEPAGTNVILRSETFSDAYWTKSGTASITANTQSAPNGELTADTLSGATGDPAVTNVNILERVVSGLSSSTSYTASIWVLSLGATVAKLTVRDATTGNVSSVDIVPTAQWQRVTVTRALGAATTQVNFRFGGTNGDISIWGAQLETGSVATSYIPTVASTVTRTADSVTLTGASSLIGQQEGTVYAEGFITNFAGAIDSIFTISDGTVNNRIEVNKRSPNTIALERVSAIQSGATTISSGALSTGLVRIAIAYKTGDTAIFINGVQAGATSTATFTMPTIGNLVLGANATAGTRFWNSNVRSFAVFPTRLPNATLATLTA